MGKVTEKRAHLAVAVIILIAMVSVVSAATQSNQTDNGSVILPDALEETMGVSEAEVTTTAQSFAAGDHVRTTAELKVRAKPGTDPSIIVLAKEPAGANGVIVGDFAGGMKVDGYSWYIVRYQDGVRGWSASEYLEKTGSETVSRQLTVPYVHQCYDTAGDFAGQWACGAACAVMTAAYYNAIEQWPFQSPYPSAHTSPFGNYVSRQYTTPSGEVIGDESDEQTRDAAGNVAKGAYGYIHYPSGSAGYQNMVDYLKLHGIDAEADFSPTEAEVQSLIANGFPVSVSTKLTDWGHWVLITGYTSGGYYIVNDPNGCAPYTGDPCWKLNFNNYGRGALYTWSELQTADKYMFRIKSYSPPKPEVEVQAPRAGDVLDVGAAQLIKWSATSGRGVDHIKLEFTSTGGMTWSIIAANEANDGQYLWAVPDAPSTNCWIRVTAYDTDGQSALDITDGSFTIRRPPDTIAPIVHVDSPNDGGEVWIVGRTQQIRWASSDNGGIASIDLAYSTNGGNSWTGIVSGETNDGSYSWVIPTTPSSSCLVKVTARDAAGNTASDTSDAYFEIRHLQIPPTVTLSAPAGGAIWDASTSQTIRWTTTSAIGIDYVDLEYSSDNGITWQTIATHEVDDSSYTWQVPRTPSTTCLMRVHAYEGEQKVIAVSGAPFTIRGVDSVEPAVHIEFPNGGEIFTIGENQEIEFSVTDDVGVTRIDLTYSVNAGASWTGIASVLENTGSYSWVIPDTSSTSCLVKVTGFDAAGNQASDVCDSTFEIRKADSPPMEAPVAAFSSNTTTGYAPLSVQFYDKSTGIVADRTWTLGGDVTSEEKDPVHTYTEPGDYPVGLTVRNDAGVDILVINGYLKVLDPPEATSKISVAPVSSTLTVGQTRACTVVLDGASAGLAGYNITVCLTDGSIGEIVDVQYPDWVYLPANGTVPADSVWCKAADFKGDSGTTDITLVNVTVRADAAGTTNVTVLAQRVEDRAAGRYEPKVTEASFTVTAVKPLPNPSGGTFPPPTDQNGDGMLEDLDGNAWVGFNDVVVYYNNLDAIDDGVYGQVTLFDYDGNGWAGFNDLVLLYEVIE